MKTLNNRAVHTWSTLSSFSHTHTHLRNSGTSVRTVRRRKKTLFELSVCIKSKTLDGVFSQRRNLSHIVSHILSSLPLNQLHRWRLNEWQYWGHQSHKRSQGYTSVLANISTASWRITFNKASHLEFHLGPPASLCSWWENAALSAVWKRLREKIRK